MNSPHSDLPSSPATRAYDWIKRVCFGSVEKATVSLGGALLLSLAAAFGLDPSNVFGTAKPTSSPVITGTIKPPPSIDPKTKRRHEEQLAAVRKAEQRLADARVEHERCLADHQRKWWSLETPYYACKYTRAGVERAEAEARAASKTPTTK